MTLPIFKFKTVEEYFALEESSLEKHEYYKGEIFAMAGASINHNKIVRNALTAIDNYLKDKKCEIFPSDLKVHIEANSLYTYPDLSIVCEDVLFQEGHNDTITNPTVIIEVLSPSTMDYDRGGKFALYRALPTLKEYILISSTEYHFEKFVRQGDNWLLSETRSENDTISIETIDFQIQLAELYRNVDFATNITEPSLHP